MFLVPEALNIISTDYKTCTVHIRLPRVLPIQVNPHDFFYIKPMRVLSSSFPATIKTSILILPSSPTVSAAARPEGPRPSARGCHAWPSLTRRLAVGHALWPTSRNLIFGVHSLLLITH